MDKTWSDAAWEDYLYWQTTDKKTLKKINILIKSLERNSKEVIGKVELLKHKLSGYSALRIDQKNRLIYKIIDDKLYILRCKGHYE
jgi:toxin YoeB